MCGDGGVLLGVLGVYWEGMVAFSVVEIAVAGVDFWMDAGEPIWTESSYTFEPDRFAGMLAGSGFEVRNQWLEPADRFLLTLAEAS